MGQLTKEQRYTISSMHERGYSQKVIAETIGVHKSTISRELRRNCDQRNGQYRHELAQRKCEQRRKARDRPVRFTAEIRQRMESMLRDGLSPEQIAGRCKRMDAPCVSHERIYQHIWDDKRKGGTLHTFLRRRGRRYRRRGAAKDTRGIIPNRMSIEQRPAVVDQKQRFGDLEIDLVLGRGQRYALLTVNDRATRLCLIAKLNGKHADGVTRELIRLLEPYKDRLHTITSDNGKEFAGHIAVAQALGVDYYFAHPYHSWERGANENMNGLIRQYAPKQSTFEELTQQDIELIMSRLNNRPRKCLGFMTPNEFFNANFAKQQTQSLTPKVAFET